MEMETVGDERSSKRKETLLPRSMMSSRLVAPDDEHLLSAIQSVHFSEHLVHHSSSRQRTATEEGERERGREEGEGSVQGRGEDGGGEKDGAVCAVRVVMVRSDRRDDERRVRDE